MNTWPFVDPPGTVCVTSNDVVDGSNSIRYASHEVDEDRETIWQFHSNIDTFDFEQAKLVRLDTMLKIDPSLLEISKLPIGAVATRSEIGSRWTQQSEEG